MSAKFFDRQDTANPLNGKMLSGSAAVRDGELHFWRSLSAKTVASFCSDLAPQTDACNSVQPTVHRRT